MCMALMVCSLSLSLFCVKQSNSSAAGVGPYWASFRVCQSTNLFKGYLYNGSYSTRGFEMELMVRFPRLNAPRGRRRDLMIDVCPLPRPTLSGGKTIVADVRSRLCFSRLFVWYIYLYIFFLILCFLFRDASGGYSGIPAQVEEAERCRDLSVSCCR